MGSTTYRWILEHVFADEDPAEWELPCAVPSLEARVDYLWRKAVTTWV
jgi:hypothetical protein